MTGTIVSRKVTYEEHIGKGRFFSWRAVKITTVTLECGHTKTFRGDYVPKKTTSCNCCEKPLTPPTP